ncbi:MAG: hypothetical protein WCW33_02155 [Candidatus Babeliales bacterium]|jgi:hypothetical protein
MQNLRQPGQLCHSGQGPGIHVVRPVGALLDPRESGMTLLIDPDYDDNQSYVVLANAGTQKLFILQAGRLEYFVYMSTMLYGEKNNLSGDIFD